jgi:outer membrane protein assembly factor BamB
VLFGLGNGDLIKSASNPAGALMCMDARTGRRLWRFDAADAVHARPTVADSRVYFGSRDHHLYCVGLENGHLLWKQDLGSPVVTTAALAGKKLYAAASDGQVACLDAADGKELWSFDVAADSQARPQLVSSPLIIDEKESKRRFLYLGAGLDKGLAKAAVVYCLEVKKGHN